MDRFILLGFIGGMLGNLLRLVKIADMSRSERPLVLGDPYWYIQFAILSGLGGLFVWLYEDSITMTKVLAVNIGASAPLIAQSLMAGVASLKPPDKSN